MIIWHIIYRSFIIYYPKIEINLQKSSLFKKYKGKKNQLSYSKKQFILMNSQYEQMKKLLSPQEFDKVLKDQFSLRERRTRNPPPEQKLVETAHHSKKPSKKNRSPQSLLQKQKLSLYEFSSTVLVGQDEELKFIKQHKQNLQKMLKVVLTNKGIVEVVGADQWQKICLICVQKIQHFKSMTPDELFKIYLKYIIQYEFYLKGETLNIKKGIQITKTLSRPLFVRGRLKSIMKNAVKGLDMYRNEIVVFPKGVQELQVKYSDINLQLIRRQCGSQNLQVRIQRPLDSGFNIAKMANIPHKMTINQYCAYQQNVGNEQYKAEKFGQLLSNNKIFFGVNFEPSNLGIFSELWKHFQGNFLGYRQQFDLLSYLDSDIPGCSSPQFYLKVQGCWTGGHQQNVNMCAVNVNHGPDPSQWYTMPFSQVSDLRAVLLEKHKIDLYKDEGLWFEKINWFIENGFPIKRILQQKGDIVISGPGTLHWVRSYGIALQSAWNVFPKTLQSINASIHRHHENELLGLDKSGTIPLKSLFVKYLDHELQTMDDRILEAVLEKVKQWKAQDEGHRISFQQIEGGYYCSKNSVEYVKMSDLQALCCKCKHQIFNYYVLNWAQDGIICMPCFKKERNKPQPIAFVLHSRYPTQELQILLDNASFRKFLKKSGLKTSLCNWPHIGPVKCQKDEKGRTPCARCFRHSSENNCKVKEYVLENPRNLEPQQPIRKVFVLNSKKQHYEEGEVDSNPNKEFNEDAKDRNFQTPVKQSEASSYTDRDEKRRSKHEDRHQISDKKDQTTPSNTEKNRNEELKPHTQSRHIRNQRESLKDEGNYQRHQRSQNYVRSRDQQSQRNQLKRENILQRERKPARESDNQRSETGRASDYNKSEKVDSNRRSDKQRDYRRSDRDQRGQRDRDYYKQEKQSRRSRDQKRQQQSGRDRQNKSKKDYHNYDYKKSSRYEESDKKYSSDTKKIDETIDY